METSVYQFVMGYTNYILSEHDYGQGIPLTMIEGTRSPTSRTTPM
ncbi:hypothetical protein [Candidatus Collinsella stercoripullorum]|nr:hypothetical protein [Candidatus Collinsella stercoripullorum]